MLLSANMMLRMGTLFPLSRERVRVDSNRITDARYCTITDKEYHPIGLQVHLLTK
jgi:hypothetical protein